jgi:hypothetical protein
MAKKKIADHAWSNLDGYLLSIGSNGYQTSKINNLDTILLIHVKSQFQ